MFHQKAQSNEGHTFKPTSNNFVRCDQSHPSDTERAIHPAYLFADSAVSRLLFVHEHEFRRLQLGIDIFSMISKEIMERLMKLWEHLRDLRLFLLYLPRQMLPNELDSIALVSSSDIGDADTELCASSESLQCLRKSSQPKVCRNSVNLNSQIRPYRKISHIHFELLNSYSSRIYAFNVLTLMCNDDLVATRFADSVKTSNPKNKNTIIQIDFSQKFTPNPRPHHILLQTPRQTVLLPPPPLPLPHNQFLHVRPALQHVHLPSPAPLDPKSHS